MPALKKMQLSVKIDCNFSSFLLLSYMFYHSYPTRPVNWTSAYERKKLNKVLGHLCAHIDSTGPEEIPEDGEMTLTSRHRIRNSSPGGLRPSMLPLGHGSSPQCWILTNKRGKTYCCFETWRPDGSSSPRSPAFPDRQLQACSFNHCTRIPALFRVQTSRQRVPSWTTIMQY